MHGFFRSYIGATILAIILCFCMYLLRGFFGKIMKVFRLARAYREMMPFYPLQGNMFVNMFSAYDSYTVIYGFCGITALLGIFVYFYKIRKSIAIQD